MQLQALGENPALCHEVFGPLFRCINHPGRQSWKNIFAPATEALEGGQLTATIHGTRRRICSNTQNWIDILREKSRQDRDQWLSYRRGR